MSVATGSRKIVPNNLKKIWKTAQKMRTFFDMKTNFTTNSDSIQRLSDFVINKVRYLMECNITEKIDDSLAKTNWKMLAKLSSDTFKESEKVAAYAGKLGVTAVQVQKLKEMIQFKKKIAHSKKRRATLTENILNFLQSDVSPTDILKVCEQRQCRSSLRAAGINLVATSISSRVTSSSAVIALSSFSSILRMLDDFDGQGTGRHYLQGLFGCNSSLLISTKQAFEKTFEICKDMLFNAVFCLNDKNIPCQERTAWNHVVLSVLHAIFIDFRIDDIALILSSKLVELLETLLDSSDREVSEPAWVIYEVKYLYNFLNNTCTIKD